MWLSQLVDVLIVTIVFITAIMFLVGMWCGLRIIGKRANSINEIQFFPPKITFNDKNDK